MAPNPKLLCYGRLATDGVRASGRQHPVQRRHADGSFGLLSHDPTGVQPWSDQRLVAAHCRLAEQVSTVADHPLPAQVPSLVDQRQMLIALAGHWQRPCGDLR